MAKAELTKYQLLDDFKAVSDLASMELLLAQAEGFRDHPETFKVDDEKLQRQREAVAKAVYEEDCRNKFEERMKRKAKKQGRPLSDLLRPSQVPGGQLKGGPDPSWLQENEGA